MRIGREGGEKEGRWQWRGGGDGEMEKDGGMLAGEFVGWIHMRFMGLCVILCLKKME